MASSTVTPSKASVVELNTELTHSLTQFMSVCVCVCFGSLLSRECFSFVYRGRGEVGLGDAGAVKVEEVAWRNGDPKVLREGAEDRECEG